MKRLIFALAAIVLPSTAWTQPTAMLKITPSVAVGNPGATVDVQAFISVSEAVSTVQMAIEYNSSIATFLHATLSSDMASMGYSLNYYVDTVVPPLTPEADKVSTVQINNAFGQAEGDHVLATLSFQLNSAPGCQVSPLAFSTWCTYNQVVTTDPVVRVCEPDLELYGAALGKDCDPTDSPSFAHRNIALVYNVPNPFNPQTLIHFELGKSDHVRLQVFDVAGRRVRTLLSDRFPAGSHAVSWDGTDETGTRVPSGLFYYTLESGAERVKKRMVLLK